MHSFAYCDDGCGLFAEYNRSGVRFAVTRELNADVGGFSASSGHMQPSQYLCPSAFCPNRFSGASLLEV